MGILICNIGWMSFYEGQVGKADKIVNGGDFVKKHGHGGEVCNFERCADGNVYGHVETIKKKHDRPISIDYLGASKDAKFIDGVTVVWIATMPKGGRRVVGWYKNARVYRARRKFPRFPSPQHRLEEIKDYRIQARAGDAELWPVKSRPLKVGRGKGWIGQANWWFPERSTNRRVAAFLERLQELMALPRSETSGITGKRGGGKWGGNTDPELKAKVEAAGLRTVSEYFADYTVTNVDDQNLGWDLEAARKGELPLRLEVKGLSSTDVKVGLTPREYGAMMKHKSGQMDNYRLCVVTSALTKPALVIFRYYRLNQRWQDDRTGTAIKPRIDVLEAAIVSL
ncbi:hypothetical protein ABIC08_008648 [Bradyrhizobium sp. RT9b]|uniref:protein NO VEIN domain-containing protein n=1 Tax=Bradyrhizobium sp. RT9b TaxID=3156385 RepID=UPI003395D891